MWTVGPEITREEYLHLLDTARQLDHRQAYLLVKVFATTGVSVLELPVVTVEAVNAGRLSNAGDTVPLASGLQDELTAYGRTGIRHVQRKASQIVAGVQMSGLSFPIGGAGQDQVPPQRTSEIVPAQQGRGRGRSRRCGGTDYEPADGRGESPGFSEAT